VCASPSGPTGASGLMTIRSATRPLQCEHWATQAPQCVLPMLLLCKLNSGCSRSMLTHRVELLHHQAPWWHTALMILFFFR
jgi:hypothetical protein